jgi:tryptophanase
MDVNTAKRIGDLTEREQLLQAANYNVLNIHPSQVEFDMMTDSWTELVSPEIESRAASLYGQIDYTDTEKHAASIYPFKHFLNVSQGRVAEAWFWRAAAKKDKKVIQNLLFPTTRHHVVINRMTPVEMPVEHIFNKDSEDLFRGNLDIEKLQQYLASEGPESVGYIYIEAENNGAGGYPVSMAHIEEVHAIAKQHGIPMVVDATRLVENAFLIQRFEAGYSKMSIQNIVRKFCSHFDSMTCSLAKDFGICRGGLIATNNEKIYYRAQDAIATYGSGLATPDKAVINAALKDWNFVEHNVQRRVDQTARLHAAFINNNLPVAKPAAGHCVVIDIADYIEIANYKNPVVSFLAWLYTTTGIRSGMHMTGMTREFAPATMIRFAIPLCTPDTKFDAINESLISALKNIGPVLDMTKVSVTCNVLSLMYADYELV